MKAFANPRTPSCSRAGFTLIEVMTAVSILALLIVMLGGMLQTVANTWRSGQQTTDNFVRARAGLDLIARDFGGLISNRNLPIDDTGDSLVFFTSSRASGLGEDARTVSQIAYLHDRSTGEFFREAKGFTVQDTLPFGDETAASFSADANDDNLILDGVLQFGLYYMDAEGKVSDTFSDDARGVVILMAMIDPIARGIVQQRASLDALAREFVLPTGSDIPLDELVDSWVQRIERDPEFNETWKRAVVSGIQVVQRLVPLPQRGTTFAGL